MRCQICQMIKKETGVCNCGRILCLSCGESSGCCGAVPATFRYMHIVGKSPITDDNLVDEEGDTIDEQTPLYDPGELIDSNHWEEPDEHELGGES